MNTRILTILSLLVIAVNIIFFGFIYKPKSVRVPVKPTPTVSISIVTPIPSIEMVASASATPTKKPINLVVTRIPTLTPSLPSATISQ